MRAAITNCFTAGATPAWGAPTRNSSESTSGSSIWQVGGTLLFPQPRGYSGYLSLTLGMTRFGASSGGYDTDHKLSGSIGGGVRFPLAGNLHATLGMRGYVTLVESDNELVCVSTGGEAKCLLRSSGKTFLEAEAHAGLTFRF
jgi:hypothetical protein